MLMMHYAQLILWASLALLVYTYLGYPALIRLWSALRPRPPGREATKVEPTITLVVVAWNEAQHIRERLENLLNQDYPEDKVNILLASDGSDDATVKQARALRSPRITVIEFDRRRGKAAVLNDVVPMARGELVAFGDVRQRFASGSLRALAAALADPAIGAASGELMIEGGERRSEVEEGVGFYWRYEKFIRRHESRIDSTVGATGAIYAIRRRLFRSIPESVILDDVLIPMQIVRQGYRVCFEPRALAWDRASSNAYGEFQRKLRTIAGNFQLFYLKPWLLNPFQNRLWIQTVSHKGARLLSPLCLGAALGANAGLLAAPTYRYLFIAQILFYTAAAAGSLARRTRRGHAVLNVPYTFCLLNLATIAALFSLLHGRQRVTWKKTAG